MREPFVPRGPRAGDVGRSPMDRGIVWDALQVPEVSVGAGLATPSLSFGAHVRRLWQHLMGCRPAVYVGPTPSGACRREPAWSERRDGSNEDGDPESADPADSNWRRLW
jgi:hypothetical protein